MTEHHDLEEIRNLPSAELIELLPGIAPEKLVALREAEAADAKSRPAVIEAIDKAIAAVPPVGGKTDTEKAEELAGKPLTPAQRKAAEKAAAAQKAADKARVGANPPPVAPAADASAKAEATPAWQAEDYDGPITIPQAEWRRANLKPARVVREK